MQLAKVELFGINICGQQRYSNNATNNNNCKSIGRNNDHPMLCLYLCCLYCIGISERVCACVCLCGSCAHCVLIVWVRFAFSNLFCGLCNLFSLTLHGPNAPVCVFKCYVYVYVPPYDKFYGRT